MHIPDAMMDAKTALATGALAAGGLAIALRQARLHLPRRRVPLLGLAAAFIFSAQMLNFPVAAGTSGHLVGGVLAAALLGPSAAVIVMTAVLLVQCLLFNDGGVTALGANIWNMAIVGTVGGFAIYDLFRRAVPGLRGQIFAAAFAGWCSTVMAAVSCAGELALTGIDWTKVLPAMTGVHMLIGIGEGLITALVLAAIARTRPELLNVDAPAPPVRWGPIVVYGSLISLGVALFLSPLASAWPDGLEHVAEKIGFAPAEDAVHALTSPAPDYKLPGVANETLATSIAGAIGTIVVLIFAYILARFLVPRNQPTNN